MPPRSPWLFLLFYWTATPTFQPRPVTASDHPSLLFEQYQSNLMSENPNWLFVPATIKPIPFKLYPLPDCLIDMLISVSFTIPSNILYWVSLFPSVCDPLWMHNKNFVIYDDGSWFQNFIQDGYSILSLNASTLAIVQWYMNARTVSPVWYKPLEDKNGFQWDLKSSQTSGKLNIFDIIDVLGVANSVSNRW